MRFTHDKANGTRDMDRVLESTRRSEGEILIKTCRDIEGKNVDYLAGLGLIQEPARGDARDDKGGDNGVPRGERERLGGVRNIREPCFLSKEEMEEVARGLELASVDAGAGVGGEVSWRRQSVSFVEALPEGFLERTKDRGMVVQEWAPRAKILMHLSTGGFVSHRGWSSTLEAIVFGIPIIAMPMHLDQPLNAKLVADIGVGVEVRREDGRSPREEVVKAIKQVVVQEEGGQVQRRAKELSARIRKRQEEDTRAVMKKLAQLFGEQTNF
ncbi:hypothetical protein NL676_004755 [Syzygium grande]|nr:hypothetical protein NL676_004755 [Syzygium grande]